MLDPSNTTLDFTFINSLTIKKLNADEKPIPFDMDDCEGGVLKYFYIQNTFAKHIRR